MPLTPPAITLAIQAAGPELKGPVWIQLTAILGAAVAAWAQLPANLALQGFTSGVAGSGTVTGKVSVIPASLPVPAAVSSVGLVGFIAPSIARAVGMGVAAAFNASASYQGGSIGVGVGSDISKVSVANGPSLAALISTTATSMGFVGFIAPQQAMGLGNGIAGVLLAGGTGVGGVVGPGGPAPAVGTSVSKVL